MKFAFVFLFISAQLTLASEEMGAYRDPTMSFEFYQNQMTQIMTQSRDEDNVLSTARLYTPESVPETTRWGSIKLLNARFQKVRDERLLIWKNHPDFIRRITWLYPKDGCFARAAVANAFFYHQDKVPVPGKAFVFGSLKVKTPFNKNGIATWWFHVAPIVQVAGVKYILDPSIESSRPLTLHEWLLRMGNPSQFKLAICGSGAFAPSDSCHYKTDGIEARGYAAEAKYLPLEWNNLISLGRSPTNDLGVKPPWLQPSSL